MYGEKTSSDLFGMESSSSPNTKEGLSTKVPFYKSRKFLLPAATLLIVGAVACGVLYALDDQGFNENSTRGDDKLYDDENNRTELTAAPTTSVTTAPTTSVTAAPTPLQEATAAPTEENVTRVTRLDGNEFEGDILLDFEEAIARRNYEYDDVWDEKVLGPRKRMLGARATNQKWPNNIVIYEMDDAFPNFMKLRIWNAMREIEATTCFTFGMRPENQTRGYVEFKYPSNPRTCSAHVGYYGGHVTDINLGNACDMGAVVHEIIHCIGFHHTQSRTDRDNYVTILWDNIPENFQDNFRKLAHMELGENAEGRQYDYASVMHYGETYFAHPRKSIDARGNRVGTRELSKRDVIQLNEHAGCPVPKRILTNGRDGMRDGKSTYYREGAPAPERRCKDGDEKDGLLCYPKCRSGFTGVGPVCWRGCEGYGRDDGMFCAKPSPYGRGVGRSPTCRDDEDKNGALCYPKCRSGYYGVGPVCWKGCNGFGRDDGAFCAKPGPYGRGAGRSPCTGCSGCTGCGWGGCSGCSGCSSCSTSHCRDSEQVNGLLCYPKCRAGFHNFGCCICSPNCPSGYTDIGVSCAKPSYGRGAGRIPNTCRDDEEMHLALCYPKCRPGYHAFGCCICSPDCPSGYTDIGVSCKKPSYGRGVGSIEEVVSPPAPPPGPCKPGYVRNNGHCYEPCDVFYKGYYNRCSWDRAGWANGGDTYEEWSDELRIQFTQPKEM